MCPPLRLTLGLLFIPALLAAQLHIFITAVPENTPYESSIFIAGDFNTWNAGDSAYQLQSNELGILEIELAIEPGLHFFKFTRGNWDTVEGNADGDFRPNRQYDYPGGTDTLQLEIAGWEGPVSGGNTGTAVSNVSILSEDFQMPQLDRRRRIWIYLPPDYAVSTRRYPVIYMQDGQNLFDKSNSFSGEWEIDESLNQLFSEGDKGVIIVGIDNGGEERIDEYSPWVNKKYGGGRGALYADFIVETLKPHIDKHYRTIPEQQATGIAGSSMGGLIALYTALEYQTVFGRVGIFSPALWFSPEAYVHITESGKEQDMRFYLMAGKEESTSMYTDMVALYNNLLNAGFQIDEVKMSLPADGQHSEWFWAREFADAYLWLTAEETPVPSYDLDIPRIHLRYYPDEREIRIEGTQDLSDPTIQLYSVGGDAIKPETTFRGKSFSSSFLRKGTYLFVMRDGEQVVGSEILEIE
jgi:predicted alpha/beta superfamily hydrolase